MEDNRNNNDFFGRSNRYEDDRNDRIENREEQHSGAENEEKQPAHEEVQTVSGEEKQDEQRPSYYTYGPYASSSSEERTSDEASNQSRDDSEEVEISAPRPVKGYGFTVGNSQNPSKGTWEFRHSKPKRSSFMPMFAAFLVGALVVGSLMFGADKYNLFTGGQSAASASQPAAASAQSAVAKSGNNGNVVNAADVVRPNDIAQIVQSASPAVVKVTTYAKTSNIQSNNSNNPFFNDPLFQQFFGGQQAPQQQNNNNNNSQGGNQYQELGLGSGFIYNKDGYILTNQHVVEGADKVEVTVEGHKTPYVAKVLGSSFNLDLAVLKIDGTNFPTLPIGNSDQMESGDWVIAIGNPYGFDHTVTVGVLSAKGRPININDNGQERTYENLLQTDASINPGNSGGPLINLQGQVIGMNTAVSTQAQGIGFAIPSSTILQNLTNLQNNVKIPVPYIGVYMGDISQDLVGPLHLKNTDGVIIHSIVQGTPAAQAGLQPYDVITKVNGETITSATDFQQKIKSFKVGDRVTLTVIRNGQTITTGITIGDKNKYSSNK